MTITPITIAIIKVSTILKEILLARSHECPCCGKEVVIFSFDTGRARLYCSSRCATKANLKKTNERDRERLGLIKFFRKEFTRLIEEDIFQEMRRKLKDRN